MLPQSVKYLIGSYSDVLIREKEVRTKIDFHRENYFVLREAQSKAERADGERHRGKVSVLTDELMSLTRKKKDLEEIAIRELVESAKIDMIFKEKENKND